MKHVSIFAAVSVALCAAVSVGVGCSSTASTGTGTGGTTSATTTTTTTTNTTGTGGSTTTGTGGGFPAPPTIGTQIDRIGRPAINTALNHAFDPNSTAGTAKDAYNADATPSDWQANYAGPFVQSLAIIDAIDGVCGNQLGYMSGGVDGGTATSYSVLASALTDDELYVNTAGATCLQYLAVEANALGVLTNTDCGGRAVSDAAGYVVMDVTYSVLASGALSGVKNGIEANNVPFLTTFPYEAAANAN